MKHKFCLMVFALWCVAEFAVVQATPHVESEVSGVSNNILKPLKRMTRQMPDAPPPPEGMPPPPDGMPPPPDMPSVESSRKRREAKGGGSMPTRKG